jgi:porin
MFDRSLLFAVAALFVFAAPAFAEEAEGVKSFDGLTGDWGGFRTKMDDHGIDLSASNITDLLGNVSGGTGQSAIGQGRVEAVFDVDFEKLAGLKGLTFHTNAYGLYGHGMSKSNLNNNIMTASNIEAPPTVRLFDLWFQQNLLHDDVSIRFGQLAADEEFMISQYGGLFINSVYGWPSSLATNLPGGGAAYPLATPGVRVKIGQTQPWSFQVGVYDGDPTGQGGNLHGTNFNIGQGALSIAELAYGHNTDKDSKGLPGTYKLGAWYHTENFDDKRFDNIGLSLANPGSTGTADVHHGNYGFYGVVDQGLWREKNAPEHGLNGFTRVFWMPDDRNLADFQIDVGLNYKGLIRGRDDDTLGLAFSYLNIGKSTSDFDKDTNRFNATSAPVRGYESMIELTYQAPITPWFTVQPDFQYIMHPGGNVEDPTNAAGTKAVEDAAIIGVRGIVTF